MADYVESLLADNEKILMNVKQHWIALIRFALTPILILIGALIVGAISISFSGEDKLIRGLLDTIIRWVAIGMLAVAVVWLPIQVVRWTSRRYVLTNRRIIESDGLLRKRTSDAGLDKITDVGYVQPWLGARLGYGDISVVTAAGAPITLDQIIGANEFKKAIMEAQEALIHERAAMMMPGGVLPSAATPAPAQDAAPQATALPAETGTEDARASSPTEISATLASLTDMREAGTISDADFEAKKKELLGRL